MKDILEPLEEFEAELANRGTTFFGGKQCIVIKVVTSPQQYSIYHDHTIAVHRR